jgi:NAD-dependent SIR2 family protein deacetylase
VTDKRVFVLGAGASISHSNKTSPDVEGFFVKNKLNTPPQQARYKAIHDHIENTFHVDIFSERPAPKINIETIFTQLELDIENSQTPSFLTAKKELLGFIQEALSNLQSSVPYNNKSDYYLLWNKLKKNDTLITFNWDTMLDNAMGREAVLDYYLSPISKPGSTEFEQYKYFNFVTDFSGIRGMTSNRFGQGRPLLKWVGDKGYYFKMHGSVDWRYCDNEICKSSNSGFPVLEVNDRHICSECYEEMKPLIIPPVLNKQLRKYSLIRKMWSAAAREMKIADEIVIWGYSLPPTDFYSEWLLRQGDKSKIRVSLINPSVVTGKLNRPGRNIRTSFVKRFAEIFQLDINSPQLGLYENFEDYRGKQTIQDKYKILNKS